MPVTINGTTGIAGVDGSASTPSYQGTDTNTGIFYPAADTIAFAEGGTEVMRLDSSGNLLVGTTSASTPSSTGFISSANTFGFKNRIINGAMQIDQRNAGASLSLSSFGLYSLDRWQPSYSALSKFTVQQNAGSVTPPVSFTNYLGITSSAATSLAAGDFYSINQPIEGFNVADLAWGTTNAKTVTLSFWVRSSLTGTFGGALRNSATNRSYPFTYSISSANTWEQKTITIAGDTTGTWLTNNGIGITVSWGLGVGSTFSGTAGSWAGSNFVSATGATSVVGTNGATFYLTGVQLEVGTAATSFDVRPYGTELNLCYRYYYRQTSQVAGDYFVPNAYAISTTQAFGFNTFPVPMRTRPTALEQSGTAADYNIVRCGLGTNSNCSAVPAFDGSNLVSARTAFTVASGLSNGTAGSVQANNTTAYLGWSAEL